MDKNDLIPKCALPLIEPLIEKQRGPLKPKPYRIMQNIKEVSVCMHNNAAIDMDGNLWSWGATELAVQDNGRRYYSAPQNVNYIPKKMMSNVVAVSAGAWHTVYIANGDELWGWGKNFHCELGLDNLLNRKEPTFILDGVKSVYANEGQTFAIKHDGSLWGWGDNWGETLFHDSERCRTPKFIMDDVESVCANNDNVLVIKKDKTLWGWGKGSCGIIFSAKEKRFFHQPTFLMDDVISAAIPADYACGYCFVITEDHSLHSIGIGNIGSLVSSKQRSEHGSGPIKVMENVSDVWAGSHFTFIRMLDGNLYSVGLNDTGQCGLGTSTGFIKKARHSWRHVTSAGGGYNHGAVLQDNGDLWIFGGDYGISIEERKSNARP